MGKKTANKQMQDAKPWWTSKTIIGALVQIVISVAAAAFGLTALEQQQDQIVVAIASIANGCNALWNIYGRVKAEKRIR